MSYGQEALMHHLGPHPSNTALHIFLDVPKFLCWIILNRIIRKKYTNIDYLTFNSTTHIIITLQMSRQRKIFKDVIFFRVSCFRFEIERQKFRSINCFLHGSFIPEME